MMRAAALLVLAGLLGCAAGGDDDGDEAVVGLPPRVEADAAGDAVVVLDSAERRRLDVLAVPLSPVRYGGQREMLGELLLDSTSITTVRAAVPGRLVVESEARWPAYDERIAAGRVLGVVGDARPLTAPRTGRVTRVFAQPGELVQAGQPLLELADLDRPLARLVWFGEAGPEPPTEVRLEADGLAGSVTARLVGASPQADATTLRPAFLYRVVRGWPGARSGLPVVARFGGGFDALQGVQVPAAAVVQWDGFAWVYVEGPIGKYQRRRITTDRPMDGAWFVAEGLTAGQGVVVRGAQALLSEEFRARISVGDESDK